MTPPRGFARRAPGKLDKTRSVDIRITDMVAADAAWWDVRVGPRHARIRSRADRYWAWSVLLPMCQLVQLAKRRHCRCLVIWARNDRGRFLRVGMSIIIESYPYLDVRRRVESNFVWFISAADPDLLQSDFAMSQPPALGRVLLDCAIVLSENAGLEGRTGLHAAGAGGGALLSVYRACGLYQLAASAKLPPGISRPNDGRFFYTDEARADEMAARLDPGRWERV